MVTTNWRDVAFKAAWTGIAAVLGYALVAISPLDTWWALPATMVINAALAYVRQRVGETPPTAETGFDFDHSPEAPA